MFLKIYNNLLNFFLNKPMPTKHYMNSAENKENKLKKKKLKLSKISNKKKN